MEKKLLTTKNIAEYCHVTQRTAVQWINEGKLKCFRTLGKHIRVYNEDFIGFLEKHHIPVPEELTASAGSNGKKRILIVDDEESMVDAIRRLLKQTGLYDLDVAYDGFEAGQKFAEKKPDLIILDLRMPGCDGYQVCSYIRKSLDNRKVKILAISGMASDTEGAKKIMRLGADEYLLKPFTNAELKSKIRHLLGQEKESVHAR